MKLNEVKMGKPVKVEGTVVMFIKNILLTQTLFLGDC